MSAASSASLDGCNAIDVDLGTEWFSAGDGNGAFIAIDLGEERQIAGVEFLTRTMADGSVFTTTVHVAVDDESATPFLHRRELGDPSFKPTEFTGECCESRSKPRAAATAAPPRSAPTHLRSSPTEPGRTSSRVTRKWRKKANEAWTWIRRRPRCRHTGRKPIQTGSGPSGDGRRHSAWLTEPAISAVRESLESGVQHRRSHHPSRHATARRRRQPRLSAGRS